MEKQILTTAERRRWALDMRDVWQGTDYEDRAEAHAALIEAQADIEDIEADREPRVADTAEVIQTVPILGDIHLRGGKIISIDHPYDDNEADRAEAKGIYTAWEWRSDPSAELETGQLVRLYIGSKERGPEAQYNAYDNTWYRLISNGNFGKRYACGGTWRGEKCDSEETPEIFEKIKEVFGMDKKEKIEAAKAKLKAAQLRVKAAHQREMAAAYSRQATHPIYPGQEVVCLNKAGVVDALANQTLAEADLIEMEA